MANKLIVHPFCATRNHNHIWCDIRNCVSQERVCAIRNQKIRSDDVLPGIISIWWEGVLSGGWVCYQKLCFPGGREFYRELSFLGDGCAIGIFVSQERV